MKRVLPLLALVYMVSIVAPATARQPYLDTFIAHYAKDEKNKEFNAKVNEVKCGVCHMPMPAPKKERNEYGIELAKLLDYKKFGTNGDRFKTDTEAARKEVIEAFKKVEEMKAKNGDTFGKRIKEGKLPGVDPATTK